MRKMFALPEIYASGELATNGSQYLLDRPIQSNKIYLVSFYDDEGGQCVNTILSTFVPSKSHLRTEELYYNTLVADTGSDISLNIYTFAGSYYIDIPQHSSTSVVGSRESTIELRLLFG